MNLNERLRQTTKEVQESQRLAIMNEAKDAFTKLETYLLVSASKGKTSDEFIFLIGMKKYFKNYINSL